MPRDKLEGPLEISSPLELHVEKLECGYEVRCKSTNVPCGMVYDRDRNEALKLALDLCQVSEAEVYEGDRFLGIFRADGTWL